MKYADPGADVILAHLLTAKPDMDAIVPGDPMGKQREGGTTHRYTLKPTERWMDNARDYLWFAWHPRAPIALNEPVAIRVNAVLSRDRWSKGDHDLGLAGPAVCTDKPDYDNIDKIVFDSMIYVAPPKDPAKKRPKGCSRFILADDKSIVAGFTHKVYAGIGEAAHVRVRLYRLHALIR